MNSKTQNLKEIHNSLKKEKKEKRKRKKKEVLGFLIESDFYTVMA
jgi:hypothetical protein